MKRESHLVRSITYGTSIDLDFAFWLLQWDGLQVPPFDRHAGGSGDFRRSGGDGVDWISWVYAIVRTQKERHRVVVEARTRWKGGGGSAAFRESLRDARERYCAPAVWPGIPAVRGLLAELWPDLRELDKWPGREILKGQKRVAEIERQLDWEDAMVRVLSDNQSHRAGIGSVELYHVDYPGPLVYPVPPNTLILALRGWQPRGTDYVQLVMEGISRLAGDEECGLESG